VARRRKRKPNPEDDEDRADNNEEQPQDGTADGTGGTVLVTLRNVPPYTDWYIRRFEQSYYMSNLFPQGPPKISKKPSSRSISQRTVQSEIYTAALLRFQSQGLARLLAPYDEG